MRPGSVRFAAANKPEKGNEPHQDSGCRKYFYEKTSNGTLFILRTHESAID